MAISQNTHETVGAIVDTEFATQIEAIQESIDSIRFYDAGADSYYGIVISDILESVGWSDNRRAEVESIVDSRLRWDTEWDSVEWDSI